MSTFQHETNSEIGEEVGNYVRFLWFEDGVLDKPIKV